MHVDGHTFQIGRIDVGLSITEFALMQELMRNPGRMLSHDQLRQHLWGDIHPVNVAIAINTYVKRIRRKIHQIQQHSRIETVRGVGYRLRP